MACVLTTTGRVCLARQAPDTGAGEHGPSVELPPLPSLELCLGPGGRSEPQSAEERAKFESWLGSALRALPCHSAFSEVSPGNPATARAFK